MRPWFPCAATRGSLRWRRSRSRSARCATRSFCIVWSSPRAICAVNEFPRPLASRLVTSAFWRKIRSRRSLTWRSATARCLLTSAPSSNNRCCDNPFFKVLAGVERALSVAMAYLQARAIMLPGMNAPLADRDAFYWFALPQRAGAGVAQGIRGPRKGLLSKSDSASPFDRRSSASSLQHTRAALESGFGEDGLSPVLSPARTPPVDFAIEQT
jgi:hypothetical protein